MYIRDYLHKKKVRGDIGLELEVELETPPPILDNELWQTKDDHSLRGAFNAEYVSPKPLDMDQAFKAIRQIGWELGQKKNKVLKSPRTSFHVHINALDLTLSQYWTWVTAYWLFEDLLFNWVDPYRKGNCFCLRLSDAEGVLPVIYSDLKGNRPFQLIRGDHIRYAALNVASTALHGSLEFRGCDGAIDELKLGQWVENLVRLKKYALEFKDPSVLLDYYYAEDAGELLGKFFSQNFLQKILQPDWRAQLLASAGRVTDLAYYHDWGKYEERCAAALKERDKSDKSYAEDLVQNFREIAPAPTTMGRAQLREAVNTLRQQQTAYTWGRQQVPPRNNTNG